MAARIGLDRDDVVGAALTLLEERGPSTPVSLGDVAARLGIRTQSLYAHVDGAEGLRRELALHGLRELAERLNEAAIGRAGPDAVEAIVRAWLAFAAERPGLYAATLRPPGADPEIGAAMVSTMRPLMLVLASYGLTDDMATHWYRIIFAAVHGFATLRAEGKLTFPADPDETVTLMIDAFTSQLERASASSVPS
jgi:AcrR family transcriptional regulator